MLPSYIALTEVENELLLSKAKQVHYAKNELLLLAGTPVRKLFFFKKGIVRGYRIEKEIAITHYFYTENILGTDYESYLTGEPGELYLEALTPVEVYEFQQEAFQALYDQSHTFERLGRIFAEVAYLNMVKRMKAFQTQDLKARYLSLMAQHPDLLYQVPQKYIASYLGVTPQSLSRIREMIRE